MAFDPSQSVVHRPSRRSTEAWTGHLPSAFAQLSAARRACTDYALSYRRQRTSRDAVIVSRGTARVKPGPSIYSLRTSALRGLRPNASPFRRTRVGVFIGRMRWSSGARYGKTLPAQPRVSGPASQSCSPCPIACPTMQQNGLASLTPRRASSPAHAAGCSGLRSKALMLTNCFHFSRKCGAATFLDPRGGRPALAGLGALMNRTTSPRGNLQHCAEG